MCKYGTQIILMIHGSIRIALFLSTSRIRFSRNLSQARRLLSLSHWILIQPTILLPAGKASFLKCALNARSIRNKVFDLQALLLTDCMDIIALTETWRDDNFLDSELHLKSKCPRKPNIVRQDLKN